MGSPPSGCRLGRVDAGVRSEVARRVGAGMKLKAPLFLASQNLSVRHAHRTTAAPIAAQMNSAIDPPDDNPMSDAIWNPTKDPAMPTSALVTRTRLPPAILFRQPRCARHPLHKPSDQ